ncbi:MAG: hypothetical protein D4Q77_01510 [Methanothrix sp.]|nr:MAG: hypothetical protein D4Q77_01510 [Methanothrix sp.]
MTEEKKEAIPLGETEAIDELTRPKVPENLPDDTWPLEKLIEAATKESNMLTRANAVNVLANIGGAEVIEPLIQALRDLEDPVKTNAMMGLAHLRKELVQDRMIKALLEGEVEEVRAGAAWVLGEMMDEKSMEPLQKIAEDDESVMVRVQAKASLLAYKNSKSDNKE